MIYLNHAAITAGRPALASEGRPASLAQAKEAAAEFFHLQHPGQVQLVHSGGQAVELALRSFLKKGDHVIATDLEYDGTCKILEELKGEEGIEVSYLGVNPYGVLRYEEIESLIQKNTKALVCAHGCGVTGNITDLERISAVTRRHGMLLISDGCQAAGGVPVDFAELGADVYCFTAHKKLLGPHGLGGLCLKEGLSLKKELLEDIEPFDEEKLGRFCGGIRFILDKGLYGVSIYPHRLAKRFFEAVKSMDAVRVYGDFGTSRRLPIVSIQIKDHSPQEVKRFLAEKHKIVVGAGLGQGRRMHQALGTAEEGLLRFSFGYTNTRGEVNDAIWALMDLLGLEDLYLLA